MPVIQWSDGESRSVPYAPGDSIATDFDTSQWRLLPYESGLIVDAGSHGSLTLFTPDGTALAPEQVNMAIGQGGVFMYAGAATLVTGGAGHDFIVGGAADNRIQGGDGDDVISGGAGNDQLDGGAGDDYLQGGDGDDTLVGGSGEDMLTGGNGNDILESGGTSLMTGQDGNDRYVINNTRDVVWDSSGDDSGIVHADWFKTNPDVEHWSWAPGVQRLPYWIDALIFPTAHYPVLVLHDERPVYYTFAKSASDYERDVDRQGFVPFTAAEQSYTRTALDYISTVADVHFEERSEPGLSFNILMGNNDQDNSGGYSNMITGGSGSPLLLANSPYVRSPGWDGGARLYSILMHELGHSLGLKHPFSHPEASGSIDAGPYLSDAEDQVPVTVMSYTGSKWGQEGELSPLDIAALQYLWGVPVTAKAGDTVHVLKQDEANMIWDGSGNDTIDGAALTADLTLFLSPGYWSHAGAQAATITAAGQYTVNFGTVIENALGGSGNDMIAGNTADNVLSGGAGNDTLVGANGNDRIDGGTGVDTAVFAGKRSDWTLLGSGSGSGSGSEWSVRNNISGETDTLAGIERLHFDDTMVMLDTATDSVGASVYRLYQAAFDRQPDLVGVGFWITQADRGASMASIADTFLHSDEFAHLYGDSNPSNDTFLTKLYSNVLHRQYEQGGYDFWQGALQKGVSRAEVLLAFAASDENVQQVAVTIGKGFDYTFYG